MFARTLMRLMAALTMFLFSSCAAMFSGTKDEVLFRAQPAEGSYVYVGEKCFELTGDPVEIPKKTREVMFSNPAYGDFVVPLKRKIGGGWVIMDILFTPGYGITGLLIDGATGAWYKLPSTVTFDFSEEVVRQRGEKNPEGTKIARADEDKAGEIRGRAEGALTP